MSHDNPRIRDLSATPMQILVEFAEGNPGAITAMLALMKAAPEIDPDSAFGPMSPLFSLDNLDCYGSRIWMLYKDVCGQDVHKVLGLMRANQLGFVSEKTINAAISGDRAALDIPDLLAKVKERLPAFAIE